MDSDHGSGVAEGGPTFILTWNPDLDQEWADSGYEEAIQATAAGGIYSYSWGCWSGQIRPGNRAFLLRQRRDRGLVGSGVFTSAQYRDKHWNGSGKLIPYGMVSWEIMLDAADRLPIEDLKNAVPEQEWDNIPRPGIKLPSAAAARTLSGLWARHTSGLVSTRQTGGTSSSPRSAPSPPSRT